MWRGLGTKTRFRLGEKIVDITIHNGHEPWFPREGPVSKTRPSNSLAFVATVAGPVALIVSLMGLQKFTSAPL